MKKPEEGQTSRKTSETVLGTLGNIIPGFHGFFKKMEGSKTFGPKIAEIRKEIEKRFGGVKK